MGDDFHNVAAPAGGYPGECQELPLRLGRYISDGRGRCQWLPIRNCEIDHGVWIKCKTREIQSEPPIENIVECEIAEVTQAIRARRLTRACMKRTYERRIKAR